MNKNTVYVIIMGCTEVTAMAERQIQIFHGLGYQLIVDRNFKLNKFIENIGSRPSCSYYLVYGCALYDSLDNKIKELIKFSIRMRHSTLVLTGCLSWDIKSNVSLRIPILESCGALEKYFASKQKAMVSTKRGKISKAGIPDQIVSCFSVKTERHVLIKTGCSNNCTFCICPRLVGKSHSRGSGEIIAEIKKLENSNIKNIRLAGVNTSDWSQDRAGRKITFCDLLKMILDKTQVNINGLEIHPGEYDERIIEILQSPRIEKIINLYIQSGSDKLLKLFNRKHDVRHLLKVMDSFFSLKDIQINSGVIVGAPAETEVDFSKTLNILKRYPFRFLMVDRYYSHSGIKLSLARKIIIEKRLLRIESLLVKKGMRKIHLSRDNEGYTASASYSRNDHGLNNGASGLNC